MNENARAWVAALRSGEYQQARGQLKKEHGYCCLGVACEISKLGKWTNDREGYYQPKIGSGDNVMLPEAVKEWLGMKTGSGTIIPYGHNFTKSLATENDNGKSFNEIADLIEKHQDILFK